MDSSLQSRLKRIRVPQGSAPCASLVFSLHGILEAYGRPVDIPELGVLTGNAFMLTYAAAAPPRDRWNAYGRHAFLEAAAATYGLILRDLHPPVAAPLPQTPPEFDLHFRDSYMPFIRTAVERDEPVLAWMGWPSPHTSIWGVITGIDATSQQCIGQTMFSRGQPAPLTGSPVQVYTVQEYREMAPRSEDLIAAVLDRAALVLNDRLDPDLGVCSGVASLERWRQALLGANNHVVADDSSLSCDVHLQMTQMMVMARNAAIAFLEAHLDKAAPGQREVMQAYASLFRRLVGLLQPFIDEEDLRLEVETEERRGELARMLDPVIELERSAAAVRAL